jgi:hypothetical protein
LPLVKELARYTWTSMAELMFRIDDFASEKINAKACCFSGSLSVLQAYECHLLIIIHITCFLAANRWPSR